ncbi:hypothetical protein DL96DRAFT_1818962 [Flagelloscypha sp. PMI_526]|nr:hypothetical protein DL96DRAFT_1818962 [Flagelloscypha sp. PMI_526]
MMYSVATITLLFSLATARPLHSTFGRRQQETDVNKCRPLGADRCTLTVTDALIAFPAPGSKETPAHAETVESNGVGVFDSTCLPKTFTSDIQPLGAAKGFGGPIKVEGFAGPIDFFAQEIGIGSIAGIKFTFLGKDFNACDCQDDSSGLTGKIACRCEFDCPPGPASGFASGNCGIHVTQFQKPDPSKDNYKLDIKLFDSVQAPIGDSGGQKDAPANKAVEVTSKLPNVMIVTAQNVDADPIKFAFGGENFDSNAAQCSVGGYDSGKREMDCSFTC